MKPGLVELGSNVRLGPVIELAPSSFGSCPDLGPGPWTAEQSALYWRTCLAGSGIFDLMPVRANSLFVSVENIASPFPLNKIVEVHLEGVEPATNIDDFSPLAGGFVLYHGVQPILFPGCCGDLSNLEEWKKILTHRVDSPTMLWVGHPWFSYWFEENTVCIREEREYSKPEVPKTVRLPADALESAIIDADREIDEFLVRLNSVLEAMPHFKPVDQLGAHLAGRQP